MPNSQGLWSQKPYPYWFLGPGSFNTGYLDHLGNQSTRLQDPRVYVALWGLLGLELQGLKASSMGPQQKQNKARGTFEACSACELDP